MEQVAIFEPPIDAFWRADQEIHWEGCWNFAPYLECLIQFVPGRHDDEDVHVAVGVRRTVGIGAKEDDFLGLETLGNLARESANQAHGNVGPAIPPGNRGLRRCAAFDGHEIILG